MSIIALFVGCFDGEAARGYPCETDDDCGPALTCASTGCCGGACLFGADTGTDGTSTSAGTETSTSTSSTTIDPSSSSSSESSSSTGEALPECGNGTVEGDEECDLGELNEMGTYVECNRNCRAALFFFSADQAGGNDFCGAGAPCGAAWFREGGDDGPWASGVYPQAPTIYQLVSQDFLVPSESPMDLVPVLRIEHDFDFNVCESTPDNFEYFDGAHVQIQNEAGARFHVSPIPGDPDAEPPTCVGSNTPWCDVAAPPLTFVESSGGIQTPRLVALDEFQGERIRIVFELAFDAGVCEAKVGFGGRDPHPWKIFEVVVAYDDPPPR